MVPDWIKKAFANNAPVHCQVVLCGSSLTPHASELCNKSALLHPKLIQDQETKLYVIEHK